MLRKSIVILLIFSPFSILAQTILYLDQCEEIVSKDDYSFRRIVRTDSTKRFSYLFKDYYLTGELYTEGRAKSKNGKSKKGLFNFYRRDGSVMATGEINGYSKINKWTYWQESISTTKDELLKEIPNSTQLANSDEVRVGKCLCYFKEGEWSVKGNKNSAEETIEYFDDGLGLSYPIPDVLAEYKDGLDGFYDYIHKNLKYPLISRILSRQGQVNVEFIITEEGNVRDIKFITTLDKKSEKHITSMLLESSGDWKPATLKGEPLKTKLILPITFSLK